MEAQQADGNGCVGNGFSFVPTLPQETLKDRFGFDGARVG